MGTIVLLVSLAHPLEALADDCPEDRVARARALFDEATAELQAGHAAEGRDLLRSSLAACPTFATRMNLTVALRRTGEAPEAMSILESMLAGDHGELSGEQTEAVRHQLGVARAELSTLRVFVHGPARAEVEVDGEPAGRVEGRSPLLVQIGAGSHVVSASARGHGVARQRVRVASGSTADVRLTLSVVEERRTHVVTPVASDDGGGSTAWIWIGVAAAAIAGAVVAGYLLLRPEQSDDVDARFVTLVF